MLRTLLAKDLRRAGRNPARWIVFLLIPVVITGLLGLAFGRPSAGGGLGRIRVGLVDEDDSGVTALLRGAASQGQGGALLEPVMLTRADALRQLQDNRLAAAIILPAGFTRGYLDGTTRVRIEVIKNPAQAFHPAIVEELTAALVTGLNALGRNFRGELAAWRPLFEPRDGPPDFQAVGRQLQETGRRFEAVRAFVDPPRVGYVKEVAAAAARDDAGWNLFAFLLPGLASMFLLFLADTTARDLFRELRGRTFERFCTLGGGAPTFIGSKVVFAVAVAWLSAAILLGGGALLFRFAWTRPLELTALAAAYGMFAAGLAVFLCAAAGNERRAELLNTSLLMVLSFAGGAAFPVRQLPPFLRDHIAPWLPNHGFIEAARTLQFGGDTPWFPVALQLTGAGVALMLAAAWWLRRRLRSGLAR